MLIKKYLSHSVQCTLIFSFLLNFLNAHDISQPRFYDPVLRSTVECLDPTLGTDDMCLLSTFTVVGVGDTLEVSK